MRAPSKHRACHAARWIGAGAWLAWVFMRILPFAILAAAAACLLARWDALPDTWAVHWNAADVADGFATKSLASALGPLAAGGALILVIELLTVVPLARAPEELRAASRRFALWVETGVAALISMLALALPLVRPASGARLAVIALVIVLGSIAGGVATMPWKSTGDGWYGFVYKNPDDPRLWVPKRLGVGFTVNFGHPAGWPVMVAMTVLPIAIVIAVAAAARR